MRSFSVLFLSSLLLSLPSLSSAVAPPPTITFTGNLVTGWANTTLSSAITSINTASYLTPPAVARLVAMVSQAMFDAQSPYTDEWAWNTWNTTIPLPTRRPVEERNDQYRGVAASYAAYGVLKYNFKTFPALITNIQNFMQQQLGLDPSAYTDFLAKTTTTTTSSSVVDFSSPITVGSTAAGAVIQSRQHDGFNELADASGTPIGGAAFSDYSNFSPVNNPQSGVWRTSCSDLRDVNKWQPLRNPKMMMMPMMEEMMPMMEGEDSMMEVYEIMAPNITSPNSVQKWQQPQFANVKPFALASPSEFRPYPGPYRNNSNTQSLLLADMRQLVLMSCNLNDTMKVIADYWNNCPENVTPPGQWYRIASNVVEQRQLSIMDGSKLMFAVGAAMLDAGVAAWDAKRYYDSARPISAIQCLFGSLTNSAWAGPYQGVREIKLSEFMPYQPQMSITPPHGEFVSGHSTFSSAAAIVLKSFFGSDAYGASYTAEIGSSQIEPKIVEGEEGYVMGLTDVPNSGDPMSIGYSPAQPVTLTWDTFSAAADQAGESRLYGGIHFSHSNDQGKALGASVGAKVWNKIVAVTQGSSTVLDGVSSGTGSGSTGTSTNCPEAGPNVVVSFANMYDGAMIAGKLD